MEPKYIAVSIIPRIYQYVQNVKLTLIFVFCQDVRIFTFFDGAQGETRTRTSLFTTQDFKSCVSTIPPPGHCFLLRGVGFFEPS